MIRIIHRGTGKQLAMVRSESALSMQSLLTIDGKDYLIVGIRNEINTNHTCQPPRQELCTIVTVEESE